MNGLVFRIGLAALVLVASFGARAQSAQGLEVSLHTPHRTVSLDASMTVVATLRNTRTNGRLAVGKLPDFTSEGSLTLYVLQGNNARRAIAPTPASRTATAALPQRQIHLAGGEGLSVRRTLRVADITSATGDVQLVAEFRPTPGQGRIATSAPVTIRIVPATRR